MRNNPNELTIENSAVVLIDHQPAVGLAVNSIDRTLLVNNVSGLAAAAKALGVPTVLTTIGAKGSVLVDPIFKEIQAIFPEIRHSTAPRRMPGRTRRFGPPSTRRAARS
jgi:nicotinamidase-related amidase